MFELGLFLQHKTVSLEVTSGFTGIVVEVNTISCNPSVDFKTPVTIIVQFLINKGASVMAERKQGSVKWFNSVKGFGFIKQQDGEDLFVHANSVSSENRKTLEENDKVEFTITKGTKGLQASDVKIIK